MHALRRFADELGKTIVLVLHDINFASCYSDHIVAMRDGEVLFQGPPETVIREEVLLAVYDLPMTVQVVEGKRICVYFT